MESPEVSDEAKEGLRRQYEGLNPAELLREILKLQDKLLKMVTLKKRDSKISESHLPEEG